MRRFVPEDSAIDAVLPAVIDELAPREHRIASHICVRSTVLTPGPQEQLCPEDPSGPHEGASKVVRGNAFSILMCFAAQTAQNRSRSIFFPKPLRALGNDRKYCSWLQMKYGP